MGGTVEDTLGYGATSRQEGNAFSGTLSIGDSMERKANAASTAATLGSGGIDETAGNSEDTYDNDADFVVQNPPNPQNSASPSEGGGGGGGSMFITQVVPGFDATDVATDTAAIYIGFSEDLDISTMSNNTLYLTDSTGNDSTSSGTPATVVYCSNLSGWDKDQALRSTANTKCNNGPDLIDFMAYIAPQSGFLQDSTSYEVRINDTVADLSGNTVQPNFGNSYFSTAFSTSTAGCVSNCGQAEGDGGFGAFFPPYVEGFIPSSGDFNVARNSNLLLKFSEPMDLSTINTSSLKLVTIDNAGNEGGAVGITIFTGPNGDSLKIIPANNLSPLQKYRFKIYGNVSSADNVKMDPSGSNAVIFVSEFQTSNLIDSTAPTVTFVQPEDGATGVSVTPGSLAVSFSEIIRPGTVNLGTIKLRKQGDTVFTPRTIEYDPFSQVVHIIPHQILDAGTTYEIIIKTGITDIMEPENHLAVENTFTFTTEPVANTVVPEITDAFADDFKVKVGFNIPMTFDPQSANRIANKNNIVLRQGTSGNASTGSDVDLSTAFIYFDHMENALVINGVDLIPGNDFWISFFNGSNNGDGRFATPDGPIQGLNGQNLSNASTSFHTIEGPIVVPTGNEDPNDGMIGASVLIYPLNNIAGQTTTYHLELPIFNQIPSGGVIRFQFPEGFDISGAGQDANSPFNSDFNGHEVGTPHFKNAFDADGIKVDPVANIITVKLLGATSNHDFLTLDIAGIINTEVPQPLGTDGYNIHVRTKDGSGNMIEDFFTSPFFIDGSGNGQLSGVITATGAAGGTVPIYLDSPETGILETTSSAFVGGNANYSFAGIPNGDYLIFTDPIVSIAGTDFQGVNPPLGVNVSGVTAQNITFTPDTQAGNTNFTLTISGPANETLDIFANSPEGSKVKKVTLNGGGNFTKVFSLSDGQWDIGVGPSTSAGSNEGFSPRPNFMIPEAVSLQVNAGSCTIGSTVGCLLTINLLTPTKILKGTVKDANGNVVPGADVFAHSPIRGLSTFSRADSSGEFELGLVAGSFKVGAHIPGIPFTREVSVDILSNNNVLIDGILQPWAIAGSDYPKFIIQTENLDLFVKGYVFDITGAPMRNVSVWGQNANKTQFVETKTNGLGQYQLFVKNGTWSIGAYLSNYGDLPRRNITIAGQSVEDFNFSPSLTSETYYTISGNVLVAGIGPISNAFIYTVATVGGEARTIDGVTDANGHYELRVPSGNAYDIFVSHSTYGDFTPIKNVSVSGNVVGKNFTKGVQRNISVVIKEAGGAAKVVEDFVINFVDASGVGNTLHIRNTAVGAISLPDGVYETQMHLAGIDASDLTLSGPSVSGTQVTVAGNSTITVTLPQLSLLSGTITDTDSNALDDVWVEVTGKVNGTRFGMQTDNTGHYQLELPDGDYNIIAMKPGFSSILDEVTVAGNTTKDMSLLAEEHIVSGTVTAGSDPLAYAFISAEKIEDNTVITTQADANGHYLLSLSEGGWNLYAVANGYTRTSRGATLYVSQDVPNIDFSLNTPFGLADPLVKSVIPSQGGVLEGSEMGFRVTIPGNALGYENTAGNMFLKETNNLMRSTTAQPLGNRGGQISATGPDGKAIKELQNNMAITFEYSKAELDAGFSAVGITPTLEDVQNLQLSYWDETAGMWIGLPTTVIINPVSAGTYSAIADNDLGIAVQVKGSADHLSLFSTIVSSTVSASAVGGGSNEEDYSSLFVGMDKAFNDLGLVFGNLSQQVVIGAGLQFGDVVVIERNGQSYTGEKILQTAAANVTGAAVGIAKFAVGDIIATNNLADLDIDLGGFTKIHMNKNSRIKIAEVSFEKIKYEQQKGTVEYDFDGKNTGVEFQVETVGVHAAIRGTKIRVTLDDDGTQTYDLIRGKIDVYDDVKGEIYAMVAGDQFVKSNSGIVTLNKAAEEPIEEPIPAQEAVKEEAVKEDPIDKSLSSFNDIVGNEWFAPYVEKLKSKGIIKGKSGNRFAPHDPITRAEALKITLAVNNIETASSTKDCFADVPPNAWFSQVVCTAKSQNIVKGRGANEFAPNASITRAEALKVLFKAKGETLTASASSHFPDVASTAWFADYVAYAKKQGLIQGYADGTFRPNNPITRAEFVKIISVLHQL